MPKVLVATDADWIFDEVEGALVDEDTDLIRVRAGAEVVEGVASIEPDLVILDLQIGNMGGMAACTAIRNEEGMDRLPITAVLMLLDRAPDVFLAKRSQADGWLIKPLDAFRLRRAAEVLLAGYSYYEGVADAEPAEPAEPAEEAVIET